MGILAVFLILATSVFWSSAKAGGMGQVTASIHPVHSITAFIMSGVARPILLIANPQSAHHASLKPSQAKVLATTKLLIWTGPQMEKGLVKPIEVLANSAFKIALLKANRLTLIKSNSGIIDPHIWLSPENADEIATLIAGKLGELDPDNLQKYHSNLQRFRIEISELEQEIAGIIGDKQLNENLIFHDSLKYFSTWFGSRFLALNSGPEEFSPSAKQIGRFAKLLRSGNYPCFFVEAGENSRRFNSKQFSSTTRQINFNPIGAEYSPGPQLYFELMRGLAHKVAKCANGQ